MAVAAGILAGGSVLSSLLSRNPKETRTQKQKRKLVDDLIASLSGGGSFSDLFNADDATFQKSFVDPAKSRFKNQIAPQIQQSFIAGGQQRGTGLDDTLTRAGVDLDQLLNEQFLNFQQSAQNRQVSTIGSILGAGEGVQPGLSTGDKLSEGLSGFLTSDAFGESVGSIFKKDSKQVSTEEEETGIAKLLKSLQGQNKREGFSS